MIYIMINKKLVKMLDEQVNKEWFSAYLYLDIYNYYASENLDGFANWFNIQTQEERDHALLFMQYLWNNGIKIKLKEIKAPDTDFKDFREPLQEAFEHEQFITQSINEIYAEAFEQKDFRTMQFLDWFVKEQGEEEKNTEAVIKKFDLFGKDPKGLYLLDTELASRVYTAPTLTL